MANFTGKSTSDLIKGLKEISEINNDRPFSRLDLENLNALDDGADSISVNELNATPRSESRLSFGIISSSLCRLGDSIVDELSNRHLDRVSELSSLSHTLCDMLYVLEQADSNYSNMIPGIQKAVLYSRSSGYKELLDPTDPHVFLLSTPADSLSICRGDSKDGMSISNIDTVNFKMEILISRYFGTEESMGKNKEYHGIILKEALDKDIITFKDLCKLLGDTKILKDKISEIRNQLLYVVSESKNMINDYNLSKENRLSPTDDNWNFWLETCLFNAKLDKYVNDKASLLYLVFAFYLLYNGVKLQELE